MSNQKDIFMFAPHITEGAISRVETVLRDRWVGQGPLVDDFERAVEETLNISNTVAVNCSSSALRLALDIIGVGPGDEVITTPLTCTLTNHPILEQFAIPVFADIQYDTGNIDPNDIEKRITERTKAIICTHWGGYPSDLDELKRIAEKHGLPVIEDASEAFGATYRGRSIGSMSRFAAFSFQAIQLITMGEGGMLVARDASDYERACVKRWYGIDRANRTANILGYYEFDITEVGYGYHLTNIAAAIGLENLPTMVPQQSRRHAIACRYREAFQSLSGITLLRQDSDRVSANHFFTAHVERRDDFCRMMATHGIQVSIVHYRNDAYTVFGGLRSDLPQLERFSNSYIGLPLHMHLSDADVEYIIQTVASGW